VTCDFCRRRAQIRFRGKNLCWSHLNVPYAKVKLADGTPYLEEADSAVTSYKSTAGWEG
jgi:hypothetical protein